MVQQNYQEETTNSKNPLWGGNPTWGERISAENLMAIGKSFNLKKQKMTKESIRVPREESYLIFRKFTLSNETPPRRNIRCGVRIGEEPKHLGENKFNCIDIAGKGRNSVLYYNFAQEFVPMKRSQESSSFNFSESESKHTLSRLAAQRICETKILQVTIEVRRVQNTLKCEPGKNEVRTPTVVLCSELRGIESYVWFRRLQRSVSERRMPRETEKHRQKICQPKQCWFQMQKRQWKWNERRS